MLFHKILSSGFTCGQWYYHSPQSIWQMLTSFTFINTLEQRISSTEFFIKRALFSKAQCCRKSLVWGGVSLFFFGRKKKKYYHKIKTYRCTQCNRWQATEVATTRAFRPFYLHSTVTPQWHRPLKLFPAGVSHPPNPPRLTHPSDCSDSMSWWLQGHPRAEARSPSCQQGQRQLNAFRPTYPPTMDRKYLEKKFQKVPKSETWICHTLVHIYIAFALYLQLFT